MGCIMPAIDAAKIETELGWRARESFETGIEKTIAWRLKSGDWWSAILDRGYEAKRIGIASIAAAGKATTN
jgi:dTDP-glucose 4,6-dehydratase